MEEQSKYDDIPPRLLNQLRRVSPLAERAANERVREETGILEGIIVRMFEVVQGVAEYSRDYIRCRRFGRRSPFQISHVLMVANQTAGGLVDPGTIEKMEKDLTEVLDDFDRTVNIGSLWRIRETGEHLFLARCYSHLHHVEEDLLSELLKPVSTYYDRNSGCMDGTRKFVLNQVIGWATKKPEPEENNTYWIYSLPGIGKTSLAHSICAILHDNRQLAGTFFCQRDNESLNDDRNILPTLIDRLARTFPPFRSVVAKRLRDDPRPTPGAIDDSLLPELISKVSRAPVHTLVFVIDAFDECGGASSRPAILRALTDAAASARWLKIIFTSRAEVDIDNALLGLSHKRYDLGVDKEASSDLELFAQTRFERVASTLRLLTPWPEPPLFEKVISRAEGLFIFIETIARDIEQCEDPELLKATLEDSDGTGLTSLYQLYSSILKRHIKHDTDEFRQVIGALLTATQYRPLRTAALAELAGVSPELVNEWVAGLQSLLYKNANGEIRVRHLSVSDFLTNVYLGDVNMPLGTARLVKEYHFNASKLDDQERR